MANLLKIKPTRKEILQLITASLLRRRQEQMRSLGEKVAAINEKLTQRKKQWAAEVAKLHNAAPGADTRVKLIRRHAKKLGLEETSRITPNSVLVIDFHARVDIDLKGLDVPIEPELTEAEAAEKTRLGQALAKISGTLIDDSCIVAYLIDDNTEIFKEIEAVAEKIASGIESQSMKLLEGTVE